MEEKQQETKSRWNVIKPNGIPSYGLDKQAKKINAPAIVVSNRIDEYLRLNSIVTEFDSVNGVATCKTRDFLHFQIFLYAGPQSSTFLEVMRSNGCGFTFMKERQNVINAAEQKAGEQEQDKSKYFAKGLKVPSTFLDSYVPPSQDDLENMINRACDRLHSDNQEDVTFVLENLSSMTTVNTHTPNNAHRMSLLVMQHNRNVQDMILSIYIANESSMMDNDETSERIRIACLNILSNGIKSMCDKNEGNFPDHEYKGFINCLVPSLVRAVANHKSSIETACIAMACLCNLMINSSISCEMVKETDLLAIAKEAQQFGNSEHLRLEQHASAMIEALLKIS